MKTRKRAFTLIETLITIFILSFIIVLFAAMITEKVDKEMARLAKKLNTEPLPAYDGAKKNKTKVKKGELNKLTRKFRDSLVYADQ